MRRVLMIAPHFPPDSTAGTHRVRLLAPHLADHGWEPTIVTVDPRDYEGQLDPTLARSVPNGLRVIHARAWSARASRRFGVGDLGLRAFAGLKRAAAATLCATRFDALFITIYPAYPALLGPWLKKRFGVPFVLDYQDPWVGEWGRTAGPRSDGAPDIRSRASRFLAARLEPIALGAADGVTAVSRATYEQALARNPDARPVVTDEIPIGWDRRDLEFLRERAAGTSRVPSGDGRVHVSYVGTLLPTGHDTLRALFLAAARLRSSDPAAANLVRFHFFGTGNQRSSSAPARVLPIAREIGVADLVTEEPGRLDYFDALQTLVESTAVLLLGSREPHYTPSKVFPALMTERPILALYHESSTATDLLRHAGRPPVIRLITYDDGSGAPARVDDIVCALRQLIADPRFDRDAIDPRALAPSSADALAARLARVFDRVSGDGSRN